MPSRSIFLTGAPRPSALTWNESELLDDCWFCLAENNVSASKDERPSRWRVVEPANRDMGYYDAGPQDDNHGQTSFLAVGAIERYSGLQETMSQGQDLVSDFYDHSFQVHEDFEKSFELSRSLSYNDSDTYGDTSIEDTSINPSATGQRANDIQERGEGTNVPSIQPGYLSDIEDIPSATYLQSITPQTIIVNLIVAIVTIHPRKRVKTRWGHFMDIVEVVVGDETRSGFGITCWLPPNFGNETANKTPLGRALENVRPRDILLFRSVALSTFRGQVYGQSLRQNRTTVDLLHREVVDETDNCGVFTTTKVENGNSSDRLLSKVQKVRNWISKFVQAGLAHGVNDHLLGQRGKDGAVIPRALPPDTQ